MTTAGALSIETGMSPHEGRVSKMRESKRELYEHQKPPAGDWHVWLLQAGRGAGKTYACADYFDRYMREEKRRGGIIGPTVGDAVESCVEGPAGLKAVNPTVKLRSTTGGTYVVWPNGSSAKIFGAHTRDDVERLRAGGNRELDWREEIAAWRYLKQAWEQAELGLRLGKPHVIASSTPKPRPYFREIVTDPETAITRATTADNPQLPESQRRRLQDRYEGTRLGRQELEGELIDEVEGALWTVEMIETTRVRHAPELVRSVVAVDPSGGDADGNDEQGIVVVGKGVDGHGYAIADRSCKLSPDGWGRRAVQAWLDFECDRIVVETNFGGDMAVATIRTAAEKMGAEGVKVEKVNASRGKQIRAEPIAALFEQERAHVVGVLEEAESQMTQWSPEAGWSSPDRLDSLVFGFSDVMLGKVKKRLVIE